MANFSSQFIKNKQRANNNPTGGMQDRPIDSSDKAEPCTVCTKPTTTVCVRCGDFYCSNICQRKDWPSHRFICFPMPNLVHCSTFLTAACQSYSDDRGSIAPKERSPGPEHMQNPFLNRGSNAPGQRKSTEHMPAGKQRQINENGRSSEVNKFNKSPYQHNEIKNNVANDYKKQFGGSEQKENKPLRNDGSSSAHEKGASQKGSQLYENKTEQNSPLIKISPQKTKKSGMMPVLEPPFKTVNIDESMENFQALVLDKSFISEGYVGCIFQKNLPNLGRIQKYLANYAAKDTEPYTPVLDEYCLALFENDWFRAKVSQIMDKTHFKVTYIDFTNENIVTNKEIRRYPDDLKEDCCTYMCFLHGLDTDPTPEQIKFLDEDIHIEETITIHKAKQMDEGIIVATCPSIIEKMRKLSLL